MWKMYDYLVSECWLKWEKKIDGVNKILFLNNFGNFFCSNNI